MTTQRMLFDSLGPKGKRRVFVITVAIALLLLAGLVYATVKLYENQQFVAEKWSPLFNPFDAQFITVWTFLAGGLANTALAGIISIVLSLIIGTAIAISRISTPKRLRWLILIPTEFFRAVPVVISVFFASRFLPVIGIELPLLWYLVIGLVIYNSVAISEIVRAGIIAVPRGQTEASAALGLTKSQNLWLVVLPQAFKHMLPSLIAQLVIVVKDTALGFIIGFEELLRKGEIAVQTLGNPLQMYLLIGILFFVINAILSHFAQRVEERMRSKKSPSAKAPKSALTTGFIRVPAKKR